MSAQAPLQSAKLTVFLWLLVLCLLFLCPARGIADESGTLVIFGKTATAAFITVDSQVTSTGQDVTGPDASRKLLEVGPSGACAIDGWLGIKARGIALSDDLRRVLASKPDANAGQILDELLKQVKSDWDAAGYPLRALPAGRRRGSTITDLDCVDFIAGKPQSLRGTTTVNPDGTASYRRLPGECGGLLYIDGLLDTRTYVSINEFPGGPARIGPPLPNGLSRDLTDNPVAVSAFQAWKQASGESWGPTGFCPDNSAPPATSAWSLERAHDLTSILFETVEKYSSQVAPPNNTRIAWEGGRINTTPGTPWDLPGSGAQTQRPAKRAPQNTTASR